MSDYFPEENYDPDSGEYEHFDFDPIFTNRVDLADHIRADISSDVIDFDPLVDDMVSRLRELVNHGYFDIDNNRNPIGYPLLSDSEFNTQGKTSRGPFVTSDAVERWFDDTGLRRRVTAYYDEDNDLYWIDADTNS